MQATAEDPNIIQELVGRPNRFKYYRVTGRAYYRYQDVYFMAVVQRDATTMKGSVITAHIVKAIDPRGRTLWVKRDSK